MSTAVALTPSALVKKWRADAKTAANDAADWAKMPNTQLEVFGLMQKAAILRELAAELEAISQSAPVAGAAAREAGRD